MNLISFCNDGGSGGGINVKTEIPSKFPNIDPRNWLERVLSQVSFALS